MIQRRAKKENEGRHWRVGEESRGKKDKKVEDVKKGGMQNEEQVKGEKRKQMKQMKLHQKET